MSVKNGQKVKKGDVISSWDPFNNVIVSEFKGQIKYEHVIEGITYREEVEEQTGHREKVTIESRDKKKSPSLLIVDEKGKELYSYSVPVGAHISVEDKYHVSYLKFEILPVVYHVYKNYLKLEILLIQRKFLRLTDKLLSVKLNVEIVKLLLLQKMAFRKNTWFH